MNIAIVTREVSELTKKGGIGTAMRYLCEYLTLCGKHNIAIYYTGRPDIAMPLFSGKMQKRGINFYPIISWFGLLLRDQVKYYLRQSMISIFFMILWRTAFIACNLKCEESHLQAVLWA